MRTRFRSWPRLLSWLRFRRLAAIVSIFMTLAPGGQAEPPLPWQPRPPDRFRQIWPVNEGEEAALRKSLGAEYETLHTEHFSITHASLPEMARYRGEILESVYAAFVLFFDSEGFDLEIPSGLLQTVFFRTREEFVTHLAGPELPEETNGIYRVDLSRAYFYDTLGRLQVRRASKEQRERERELKEMRRRVRRADDDARFEWKVPGRPELRVSRAQALARIDRELRGFARADRRFREKLGQTSIETMCHEAVHQLSHRMGVLRHDRPRPLWLVEGLALFFEPSRNGYLLETGSVHWHHWDRLTRSRRRGSTIALRDLLTEDLMFQKGPNVAIAYSESWSLVHFLATQRRAAFTAYLRALRSNAPASTDVRRIALFESVFGGSLAVIEASWRTHVDQLAQPPAEGES